MLNLTVEQFMTKSPFTIGHDQPLSAAHRLMRDNDIRHLPVLDGDKLVGIVTQRDLHLIETLKDVDPTSVLVSEAMSAEVYTVGPRATIRKIVSQMATHKYGSAVVMEDKQVVGVFTTVDALRVLYGVLEVDRQDDAD
jgi:acetoin utilization protein AcuB